MLTQKDHNNLVWLDMEMTGLDINSDVILEIAVIVTDKELNILAKSPSYAIYQPEDTLSKMDKWNQTTHGKSGLIERVKESQFTVAQVEKDILKLLKKYVHKKVAPLCGNSIHQDRKFLNKFMPTLEEFFHYRNLDVSTLKELAKRWYPESASGFIKHNKHEALADVEESIAELNYYREQIFAPKPNTSNCNALKE